MDALARGDEHRLFDIDYQGAVRIREQEPPDGVHGLHPAALAWAEMKRRLYARSQDSEEVIRERLGRAEEVALLAAPSTT